MQDNHELAINSTQEEFLKEISMKQLTINAGEYLSFQGEQFKGIYYIKKGILINSYLEANGTETITRILTQGEIAAFDGFGTNTYQLSCVALDQCTVLKIPLTQLIKASFANQWIAWILNTLAKQTLNCGNIYKNYKSRQRIAKFLLDMQQRINYPLAPEAKFKIPMSRRQVGNYLGLTEETVCRELKALQRLNLIRVRGRNFELLNQAETQELF